MISPTTYFMCEEFKKRGYKITTFDNKFVVLIQKNNKHFYIHAGNGPLEQSATYLLCRNKYTMKQVVSHFKFPTSKFVLLTRETIDNVHALSFPLVLKPLTRFGGAGVVVGIQNREGIQQYFTDHPLYKKVLAEETLEGEDTRVLIVKGKFFAAAQRQPAFVIGDGCSTIRELVVRENQRRAARKREDEKGQRYTTDLELILYDEETLRTIGVLGKKETDILGKDEKFFVRKNANVSTGGISVDVTDKVGPSIREQCEALAASLCMSLAGIDIMTKDLSVPLNLAAKSGVIEVNSSPGIDVHILVDVGQRRNPVSLIIDEIEEHLGFKNGDTTSRKI